MRSEDQIKRCSELLYKLCDDVQRLNGLNYYDINISSEGFFIHLLNIIFDWNLKNVNFTEKNAAAIDLADKENRIAIQVTSNDTAAKIRKTLNGYREKKLYEQYDRLIIVVIKKRTQYTAEFDSAIQNQFDFDKKKDIFTIDELIQKIRDLGYLKIAEICEYLEFQLGTVMDRSHVWTIEAAFHEISEKTAGYLNENFFEVDDYRFKDLFAEKLQNSTEIHVNGFNKEETMYCILNQLHQLSSEKGTYVFRNKESWDATKDKLKDSIVIPFFESEEIPVLHGNVNIFVHQIGTHEREGIELRRRTRNFLADKLRNNGYEDAYNLIQKTNGVYYYLKHELFKGHLQVHSWGETKHIAVITAILVGGWHQMDGDIQVLETLSTLQYSELFSNFETYIGIEIPLILKKTNRNQDSYEIVDSELAWFWIRDSITSEVCMKFLNQTKIVLSDKTHLYSELLKKGMIKSLIFLALHEQRQYDVDRCISEVLSEIQDAESWGYIAKYIMDLCEASPSAVISRLEKGLRDDTGMYELFTKSSSPFLLGRSNYTHILWATEMLLGDEQYAARAARWLLEISNSVEKCSCGNNPRDIISKIFCLWYNAAAISLEDKQYLAKEALGKYNYFWDILFEQIQHIGGSIIPNQEFSYRKDAADMDKSPYLSDAYKQRIAYYELLFKHMNSNTEKWLKIAHLFPQITDEMLDTAVEALKIDLETMRDSDRESIQYTLREIVYRHRFFACADWKADESRIAQIESICNSISFEDECYNFLYITKSKDIPIARPVPYIEKNYRRYHDDNEEKRQQIIKEELLKFKEKRLDIIHLLELARVDVSYEFGYAIAEFYSDGKYNEEILKKMLSAPHVYKVISGYIRWCYRYDSKEILSPALALVDGYDDNNELFCSVLEIPPLNYELIAMLDEMSAEKQQGYWTNSFWTHNFSFSQELLDYVMRKLFEYGLWRKALDLLHHFRKQLSISTIIENMESIILQINKESANINDMTNWKISEIISYVETTVAGNYEQHPQLFALEMKLVLIIGWENSKCVQYYMKRDARLFADIINKAFIQKNDESPTDEEINIRMTYYRMYDNIHFCPGETNGQIDRSVMENWIRDFKNCLEINNQSESFHSVLGRLFAYSPIGTDGFMPHETVREMIEKYGNGRLENSYLITTVNNRGVHTVTSGETEHKMATKYRKIAAEFRVRCPKTAEIYDALARMYEGESMHDRERAENYN